jgi:hypothetical protein
VWELLSISKIMITLALILALFFLNYVSSYSLANIKSPACLNITAHDRSLIAIPAFVESEWRKTLKDSEDGNYYFTVINNSKKVVDVYTRFDYDKNNIKIRFPEGRALALSPGEEGKIPFCVSSHVDETITQPMTIIQEVEVTAYAEWAGGSAELKGSLDVPLDIQPILQPGQEENGIEFGQETPVTGSDQSTDTTGVEQSFGTGDAQGDAEVNGEGDAYRPDPDEDGCVENMDMGVDEASEVFGDVEDYVHGDENHVEDDIERDIKEQLATVVDKSEGGEQDEGSEATGGIKDIT